MYAQERAGALLLWNSKQKTALRRSLFLLVAGAGIEPASGGYEPPEVPLLYPAMYSLYQ
jgi:hypothetical protein